MPFSTFGSTFGQSTTTPAFGTTSFGQTNAQSTGGIFGGQRSNSFNVPSSSTATPAFGTPSGITPSFGNQTKSPFGSSSTFGGNTNTSFGGFGLNKSATSPVTGGTALFGGSTGTGFGFSAQQQPSTTAATFGSAPTFGGNAPTTSFGQTSSQPGGFGSGLGGFGATTSFGLAAQTTGTGNPQFKPIEIEEHVQGVGGRSSQKNTNHIQVITAMPQYTNKSFEELRWEDYQRGNKTPSTSGFGGFGANKPAFGSSPFGGASATASSVPFGGSGSTLGGFGSTLSSPFGGGLSSTSSTPSFGLGANSASVQQTSPFGAKPFGSTTFGGTSTSTFGAKPATGFGSTGGIFGQSSTSTPFGQQPATTFGGTTGASTGFGQPAGGFGSTTAAPLFGLSAATSASPFGATTAAPTLGFGSSTQQSSGFGFGGTNTGTTGNAFGSTAPAFGSSFGSTGSGAFGASSTGFGAGGGGFGSTASNPFGGTAATGTTQQTSPFGNKTFGGTGTGSTFGTSTAPTVGGFGGFGAKPTTNAFGSTATTTGTGFGGGTGFGSSGFGLGTGQSALGTNTTMSSFGFGGGNNTGASGNTGGFGGLGTGSSLSGFSSQPAQGLSGFGTQQGSSAFGFGLNKPAATTGFGNTGAMSTFGAPSTGFGLGGGTGTSAFGSGFGQPTFSLLGNNNAQGGASGFGLGTGGFGAQQQQLQQQQQQPIGIQQAPTTSLPAHSTVTLASMFERFQRRKHDVLEVHLSKADQQASSQNPAASILSLTSSAGSGAQAPGAVVATGVETSFRSNYGDQGRLTGLKPRGYGATTASPSQSTSTTLHQTRTGILSSMGSSLTVASTVSPEVYRSRSSKKLVIDPSLSDFDPGADLPAPTTPGMEPFKTVTKEPSGLQGRGGLEDSSYRYQNDSIGSSSGGKAIAGTNNGEPTGLTPTVSFSPVVNFIPTDNSSGGGSPSKSPSHISRLAGEGTPDTSDSAHQRFTDLTNQTTLPHSMSLQTENLDSTSQAASSIVYENGFHSPVDDKAQAATRSQSTRFPASQSSSPPLLTKPGYFTNPDIHQLQKMDSLELKYLPKFAVFRQGVGRIEWEGETDVRGLNLDELVSIEQGAVDVYEGVSESDKPPVGRGLNKPAMILLQNIFPREGASVKKRLEFVDKLRRICDENGSEFLDYDSETGDWVFRVMHFSRYGLAGDDSDDESAVPMDTRPPLKGKPDLHTLPPPTATVPQPEALRQEARTGAPVPATESTPQGRLKFSLASHRSPSGEGFGNGNSGEDFHMSVSSPLSTWRDHHSHTSHGGMDLEMETTPFSTTHLSPQSQSDRRLPHSEVKFSKFLKKYHQQDTTSRPEFVIGGHDMSPIAAAADRTLPSSSTKIDPLVLPLTFQPPQSDSKGSSSREGARGSAVPPPMEFMNAARAVSARTPIWPVIESPCMAMLLRVKNRTLLELGRVAAEDTRIPLTSMTGLGASVRARRPVDMSLAMGRSFRVGWSRDGRIVHCGRMLSGEGSVSGPTFHRIAIERLNICTGSSCTGLATAASSVEGGPNRQATRQSLTQPLAALLQLSNIENTHPDGVTSGQLAFLRAHDGGAPLFRAPVGDPNEIDEYLRFVRLLKDLLSIYESLENTGRGSGSTGFDNPLWTTHRAVALVSACCGQESSWEKLFMSGSSQQAMSMMMPPYEDREGIQPAARWERRREFLARWFETAVAHLVPEEHPSIDMGASGQSDETYSRILDLLSTRRITQATQLAMKAGLGRLSLLLAQLCGDDNVKHLVQSQLCDWIDSEAVLTIPAELLKIYKLLAGDAMLMDGGKDCMLSGLHWMRALGMVFWYSGHSLGRVITALQKYEETVKLGMTQAPFVTWESTSAQKDSASPMQHTLYSMLCTLLYHGESRNIQSQLGSSDEGAKEFLSTMVTQCLYPDGGTSDPLDYRGPFITLCLLESLGITSPAAASSCIVRSHMIFQLLTEGLWQWAVFVALQMPDPIQRNATARAIIDRWGGQGGWEGDPMGMQSFVVNALNVPTVWVHQATASLCAYSGKLSQQIAYLALSGRFAAADELVYRELAPRVLLSSDTALEKFKGLLDYLEELVHGSDTQGEKGRPESGYKFELLLEYYRLQQDMESLTSGSLAAGTVGEDLEPHIIDILRTASSLVRGLNSIVLKRNGDSQFSSSSSSSSKTSCSLLSVMEYDIGTYLFKLINRLNVSGYTDEDILTDDELAAVSVVFDTARLSVSTAPYSYQ